MENQLKNLANDKLIEYYNKYKSVIHKSQRAERVKIDGTDLKFGMHVVRLMLEAEQILTTGDLDLQRDKEVLKAIRRGEWTEQQVRDFFALKEKQLETLYNESKLPWGPDEAEIKKLLCQCLEMHYGSLDKVLVVKTDTQEILRKIGELCEEGLRCSQDPTDNLVELKGEK